MVLLVILGIGLIVLELFVASFGLLAAAGVICLVLGTALILQSTNGPDSGSGPGSVLLDAAVLGQSIEIVLVGVVLFAAGVIGFFVVRSQREARRRYGTEIKRSGPGSGLLPGDSNHAEVLEQLLPGQSGKIFYRGTIWTARLEGAQNLGPQSAIEVGQVVELAGWDGLIALVQSQKQAEVSGQPKAFGAELNKNSG
jgi:membrane-bound ClpP family serine protease